MKYIKVSCGHKYSSENESTNLDYFVTGEDFLSHNIVQAIPFAIETSNWIQLMRKLETLINDLLK